MSKRWRILIACVVIAVVLIAAGWLASTPSATIRAAAAFTPQDVRKIRSAISRKNWLGVRTAIVALDWKRFSTSVRLLFGSHIEDIAGFPGPPGGASVQGHVGQSQYRLCVYMVFSTTNGWSCDSANMISLSPPPPRTP